MSNQGLTWVLDQSQVGGNDRLVMMTFGHHANDDGLVWLARATIARETRLSDATVKRTIERLLKTAELEECDPSEGPPAWLSISRDRRPRIFRLPLFAAEREALRTGARNEPPSDGGEVDGGASRTPAGARRGRDGGAPERSDQPKLVQNLEPRTEKEIARANLRLLDSEEVIQSARAEDLVTESFERWWKIYPRKEEKKEAHRLYDALVADGERVEDLLAAAQIYADEKRGELKKYIKLPTTFLNDDRWREHLPSEDEDEEGTDYDRQRLERQAELAAEREEYQARVRELQEAKRAERGDRGGAAG